MGGIHKNNPFKWAITDIITEFKIRIVHLSDHSMVTAEFELSKITRGRNVWKFNHSLIIIPDFIEAMNSVIQGDIITNVHIYVMVESPVW